MPEESGPATAPETGPAQQPVTQPRTGDLGESRPVGEHPTEDRRAAESRSADEEGTRLKRLETEGDVAADYLEELLDIADLDGDLDMDVEGDRAAVSIIGPDLDPLVGEEGQVLEALQELTRLAVFQSTGERSRLMLDISEYRADRRKALEALTAATAARVRDTGEPIKLDPMTPFERKVVHDAVAAAGLLSESEGETPHRRVVILPR